MKYKIGDFVIREKHSSFAGVIAVILNVDEYYCDVRYLHVPSNIKENLESEHSWDYSFFRKATPLDLFLAGIDPECYNESTEDKT